jgi:Fe-S-cluster containining protein
MEISPSQSNSIPWFAPGLRFTCTQCGNCCTGEPGFVWVDDGELRAIAEETGLTFGELKHQYCKLVGDRRTLREHAKGDCIFLDPHTRGCKIYRVRPRQCRTWPFWSSNLQSPKTWEAVQARCPGAGHGAFVPLEEIQRQAAEIEL